LLPLVYDEELRKLAAGEALSKLTQQDQRRAELVKLRFFAGLTIAEAAQALGVSQSTADNDWAYARPWLRLEIEGHAGGDGEPEGAGRKKPTGGHRGCNEA
jgi:DNA-directed RNA polymerase specialized sigma24 family protein